LYGELRRKMTELWHFGMYCQSLQRGGWCSWTILFRLRRLGRIAANTVKRCRKATGPRSVAGVAFLDDGRRLVGEPTLKKASGRSQPSHASPEHCLHLLDTDYGRAVRKDVLSVARRADRLSLVLLVLAPGSSRRHGALSGGSCDVMDWGWAWTSPRKLVRRSISKVLVRAGLAMRWRGIRTGSRVDGGWIDVGWRNV
jgi:hypothetical protein